MKPSTKKSSKLTGAAKRNAAQANMKKATTTAKPAAPVAPSKSATAPKGKATPKAPRVSKSKEIDPRDVTMLAAYKVGSSLDELLTASKGRFKTTSQVRYRLFVAAKINPGTPEGRKEWAALNEKRTGVTRSTSSKSATPKPTIAERARFVDPETVEKITNGATEGAITLTVEGRSVLALRNGRVFICAAADKPASALLQIPGRGTVTRLNEIAVSPAITAALAKHTEKAATTPVNGSHLRPRGKGDRKPKTASKSPLAKPVKKATKAGSLVVSKK